MIFVFLSVLFFFFQNAANKEYGSKFSTGLKTLLPFQMFCHIFMVLALLITGSDFYLPPAGLLFSFLYAVNFILALSMLMRTLRLGSIGKTTLIVNLSMLIPMLLGVLFWNEKLNLYRYIGIPCVLLCMFLSVSFKKNDNNAKANKQWAIFALITFLLDGSLSVIQKIFLKVCPDAFSNAFVMDSALFGLLICMIATAFFAVRERKLSFPAENRRILFVVLSVIVGASTGIATVFNMKALEILDGIIVFPVRQGGLILAITLYGVIRYKDRFDFKTALMLLSGLSGILLLNL